MKLFSASPIVLLICSCWINSQAVGASCAPTSLNLTQADQSDSLRTATFILSAERNLYGYNYDSAFYYIDSGLRIEGGTTKQKVALLSMEGTAHYYRSDYDLALQSHLRAMEICSENGLEMAKARVFNNLGITYIKLEDWDRAEQNMSEALRISKKYAIQKGILYCLGNLGIIYNNQGKSEEAIEVYQEAILINKAMDEQKSLSRNYNNLAAVFEKQGLLEKALDSYTKGWQIGEELNDDYLRAVGHQNRASVLSKQGKFDEAEFHFEKGLALAKELSGKDLQINALKGLAELYERKGSFQKSLDARKAYELMKDSVVNETNLKTVKELEVKYETAKKEKELLEMNQQNLKNQSVLKSQDRRIDLLSIGLVSLVLLFISAIVIYRQHLNNKRKQAQIKIISDTQNEERKRIAQDLHDSIGGSLASIRSRMESYAEQHLDGRKEMMAFSDELSTTGDQLRHIAHNIMPGELMRFGLVAAVQTSLDRLNKGNFSAKLYAHGMDKRLDTEVEIHLFRIVQEAIQNVLKHARAHSLNVHLTRHTGSIDLLIEDDGIGFELSDSNKGIGHDSIRNRVETLKGQFLIDSSAGNGTTLSVKIPI